MSDLSLQIQKLNLEEVDLAKIVAEQLNLDENWRDVPAHVSGLTSADFKEINKLVIMIRMEYVARMAARGFSVKQISTALKQLGFVNFATNRPFSMGQVRQDLDDLQAAYYEISMTDMKHFKGKLIAELEEAKRGAWAKNDMMALVRAIKVQAEIVGIGKHIEIEIGERTRKAFNDWKAEAKIRQSELKDAVSDAILLEQLGEPIC